jgi:hypothetical protein
MEEAMSLKDVTIRRPYGKDDSIVALKHGSLTVTIDTDGPFIDTVDTLMYDLNLEPEDAEDLAWKLVNP